MSLRILMYHALVPRHEPYMARVHVEVAQFTAQMAWLADSGCRVLPLTQALAELPRHPAAGRPLVALTFDDGYLSLLREAAPVLAQHGFAASLFVTTGAVGEGSYAGQPGFAASAPAGDRPLTWPELLELQQQHWSIESHGCSHRALARCPLPEQVAELRDSCADIAWHLSRAPTLFAYPYGSYNRHTLHALRAVGYRAACTVHTGPATATHDLRRLPRLEVTARLSLPDFQRLVLTGYTSPGARRRAWLRDQAYRLPWLKDGWEWLSHR